MSKTEQVQEEEKSESEAETVVEAKTVAVVQAPVPAPAAEEESTSFTCKNCGKTGCRIGKYKDSMRIQIQWCSECADELEYQEDRLEPLMKRIGLYIAAIKPFPELKTRFKKELKTIAKTVG